MGLMDIAYILIIIFGSIFAFAFMYAGLETCADYINRRVVTEKMLLKFKGRLNLSEEFSKLLTVRKF